MNRIVGVGEYVISDKLDDVVKTYALGSCVALTIYDPSKRVVGMVHIALPESRVNLEESKNRPGYFADTAVPLLIHKMCSSYGCSKGSVVVSIFGGAKSMIENDVFKIGRKNVDAVLSILRNNNMCCSIIDIGGCCSRTLEIDVATGTPRIFLNPIKSKVS